MRKRHLIGALAFVAATGAASRGTAQDPSAYLAADHWAVQAAWKAEAAGLLEDFNPAQRLVAAAMVERALREASEQARGAPRLGSLTSAWLDRFMEEFPGLSSGSGESNGVLQGASVGAWYAGSIGGAAPGVGIVPPLRSGARAVEDRNGLVTDAFVALQVASRLSLHLQPELGVDGVEVRAADLTVAAGPWAASIGRQAVGYGWAEGGQVVLNGKTPFDRVEVATRRSLRLPLWLRYLGPTTFHSFLSRLSDPRHPGDPFFWGGRFSVQPHPRVTLAVHRASQFGGDGSVLPINARNLFNMLIGSLEGGAFENQTVSMSGRFRLPTERLLPLTAHLEWGAEDAAGAWLDVPGLVMGLEAPMMPGLAELSVGAEFASFPISCCGNPPWYRHGAFVGGWATDEGTLGHPLGGNGTEISVRSALDLGRAGHLIRGRAYVRDRGPENLYMPERDRSFGVEAQMTSRVRPGFDVFWSLSREAGPDWADETIRLGGRVFSSALK